MSFNSELMLFGRDKPTELDTGRMLESLPVPLFKDVYAPLKGTGKGKVRILSELAKDHIGRYIAPIQRTVDCTAVSAGLTCSIVSIMDIVLHKNPERFTGEFVSEYIFGIARHEIDKVKKGTLGGAWGVSTARAVSEYGTLIRKEYEIGDKKFDFTNYDVAVAEQYGKFGVDRELIDVAKKNPIETVSLVTTYEEVRDAIYNGYPVTIASNIGFNQVRDKEGFLTRGSRPWPHQMSLLGVDDAYRRRGVLCQNTWPYNWVSGPTRHNMPPGSFWIDADFLEKYILSERDSFVYSGYKGFPVAKVNYGAF